MRAAHIVDPEVFPDTGTHPLKGGCKTRIIRGNVVVVEVRTREYTGGVIIPLKTEIGSRGIPREAASGAGIDAGSF